MFKVKNEINPKRAVFVYAVIVAILGIAMGLSDYIFSNYFREAFDANALMRGFIELPREMPGVFGLFILTGLAFLGNIRLGIIAQIISTIGIFAMGLLSPSFELMLVFLFIKSTGMHMFIPLFESIGMSLADKGEAGKVLGKFKSIRIAFSIIAAILVFLGFHFGFFSFTTPIIWPFVIAGVLLIIVTALLIKLLFLVPDTKSKKSRLVIKKKYWKYYVMAFLFGGRKQVMFVFGPWVLIELLGFGADNIALLILLGAAVGIFSLPIVGRVIDRFGTGKALMVEAILFLAIYVGYGIISFGVVHELFVGGVAGALAVGVNVVDRLTTHLMMARSLYMRQIAESEDDVMPSLAMGMSLDHIVGISSSIVGGLIWHNWGPWWVFVFSSVLALGNLLVARSIVKDEARLKLKT